MPDEEMGEGFLSGTELLGGESFLIAGGGPSPWERLSQENAALHKKISELTRENLDLKSRQARIQSEIAQFENELQRSREGYESHIGQLEEELGTLKEELKALKDNRAFFSQTFETLAKQNEALLAKLESLGQKKDPA